MSAYNSQPEWAREAGLMDMPKDMQLRMLELFKVQSSPASEHAMVAYLTSWLDKRNLYYTIDHAGNILVTKGSCNGETSFYQCICAHMDTVHDYKEGFQLRIRRKQKHQVLYSISDNKQCGVGGDDKCGILSVLEALDEFDNLKAVFFSQEESGLIGSSNIDPDWFCDVGSIIQLDRWGNSDFICKYCYSPTVSELFLDRASDSMIRYGYKKAEGLITDSINLYNRGIGLSCVNVSCGYYQHHSANETVDMNELYNSIMFAIELLQSLGDDLYVHEKEYGYTPYSEWDDEFNWDRSFNEGSSIPMVGGWTKKPNIPDYQALSYALQELGLESVFAIRYDDFERVHEKYQEYAYADDPTTIEDIKNYIADLYK